MRIGIVCYPAFGGSGVVATDLAHGLASRGHKVHLFSYEPPVRLPGFHPNLGFHPVEVTAYPLHKYPPYTLALAARIAEVAREQRLDLVNVHYAIPHAPAAIQARQLLPASRRFALVTTCHGTDISLAGGDPGLSPLIRWSLQQSDAVTAVSRWLAEETRRIFRVPRPLVLPNFVDLGRFRPGSPDAGDPLVVHCSNLRPVKRAVDVVRAFALSQRRAQSRLLIVGDGPDMARAREAAHRLHVEARVRFSGSQADVEEVLRNAWAFLLASESESFGLSALEAMACGVPVVAPRVGGLPEVVGPTGFLCRPGDVRALGAALGRLCASRELRDRLSGRARARAEARFAWMEGIRRYEALYEDVLSRRRTRA